MHTEKVFPLDFSSYAFYKKILLDIRIILFNILYFYKNIFSGVFQIHQKNIQIQKIIAFVIIFQYEIFRNNSFNNAS